MSNKDLAIEFVKRFCAGDIDGLESLLADDARLKGPLHQFASRDDYLDALRRDPPEKGGYRLLSVAESDESVSVFYEYRKASGAMTVAQLFGFRGRRISEILVVFDGRALA